MHVPSDLRALNSWVSYRSVPGKKGKTDKVPVSPHLGTNASTTDPATWGSYQTAVDRAETDGLAGVGFVLTGSGITGVDLDHCVLPDGTIEPRAHTVIQRLNSYTEISPSGTGVHIFVKARLPPGRRRKDRVELYDDKRFLTFTGNHVDGTPDEIMPRQAEIEALHAEMFPAPANTVPPAAAPPATDRTDDDVVSGLVASENGADVSDLMAGIWANYPSQSEADLALCSHLAFATAGNAAQMDRLFRGSGLMRKKWDVGKPAYGARTIAQAIKTVHNTYAQSSGNGHGGPAANTGRRMKSLTLLSHLHAAGYTFRINDCDDALECNGERMTDVMRAAIRVRLRDNGFARHVIPAEDAYLAEAGRNRYHPVREYLSALQWDGHAHIETLASYFTDKQEVFALYLRKWLIGAVARAFTGDHHAVLVIDGRQDLGKSFFAKWLCPLPLLFRDSDIQPDNKDHDLSVLRTWVWEVGEIGSTTRRADVEALKGFLSRERITVRPPYGHYDIVKPALASFIGTANNSGGLLSDPTGSRRFNVCTVLRLDWSYVTLDVTPVWAEAHAAYLGGETARLEKADAERRNEINEAYQMPDPTEDFLRKVFTITNTATDWMATADILIGLQGGGLQGNTRSTAMGLAATMQKMGLEKRRWRGQWGYVGIK